MEIKKLKEIAAKNELTEYLKKVSTTELCDMENKLYKDDVKEDNINILSSILNEKEYRVLENYISIKDSEFLSKEFDLRIRNKDEIKEIIDSFSYYESLNFDYKKSIKWCPILIYIKRVKKIFVYLKHQGVSDEKVIDFLCGSFDDCMKLSDALDSVNENIPDYVVKQLIDKISDKISSKKSGTESYDKYINETIKNNNELFKRLS